MNAIEEIRLAKPMSQFDVAEHAQLSLPYFQDIESGSIEPDKSQLARIADALEVPVTYFHILDDESDDPLIRRFQDVARKTLGIPEVLP